MKRLNWKIFLIAILLTSNILTRFKYEINKNNYKMLKSEYTKLDSTYFNELYVSILQNFEFELNSSKLVKQMSAIDNAFRHSDEYVIVYFTDETCTNCVVKIAMDLEILFTDIDRTEVVLVGNYEDTQRFNEFTNNILPNYTSSILIPSPITFNGKKIIEPLIFIMNSQKELKFLFFPERYPELRQIYFNEILKNYFLGIHQL